MTTSSAELLALAGLVEELPPAGSYQLECDIYERAGKYAAMGDIGRVPVYTRSIDAAVTLVPEPGKWSITAASGGHWEAAVWLVDGTNLDWIKAATPALALCAAALKARAQEQKS